MTTTKPAKLNFGYGQLNSLSRDNVGSSFEPNITEGLEVLNQNVGKSFGFNVLKNIGDIKGICLGIVKLPGANQAGSWVTRIFSQAGEDPAPLLGIKVRIPELHSMLLDPLNPPPGRQFLEWDMIRTYPTFIAVDDTVSQDIPAIGDIVSVDFTDRSLQSEPVYLGKVFDNPVGLNIFEGSAMGFSAQSNTLNGGPPSRTNGNRSPTWIPPPGEKCPRKKKPDTSGEVFSLRGMVNGRGYTFQATKVDNRWIMDVGTAAAFEKMREAYQRTNPTKPMNIKSAFRTVEDQERLYCMYQKGTGNMAAKPGHSNHQSGVAIDLTTLGFDKKRGKGELYNWLEKNAHLFGFKRIPQEHWHWEHTPSLQNRGK